MVDKTQFEVNPSNIKARDDNKDLTTTSNLGGTKPIVVPNHRLVRIRWWGIFFHWEETKEITLWGLLKWQ